MKLIGIDYGRCRVGLAVTDDTATLVRGLPTINRKKNPDWISLLLSVIASEQPIGLVIGLPLDLDDRETIMSAEIRIFAADLEKQAAIPVYFIDESLSSKRAQELLMFRKKKERRSKEAVDRLAACLILESFLKDRQCVGEQKPFL